MRVVGIEVAKTSVICCVLTQETASNNPAKAARTYKPQKLTVSQESLDALAGLGDLFVIEPTGTYSRIWYEFLRKSGKDVRKVSPQRVTHLRRYFGVETKSDRYDAYFLALYGLNNADDRYAFLEPHAEELRELILQHHMLSKATTTNVNRLWRTLAYEWPEACVSRTGKKPYIGRRFGEARPPALLRFIAGEKVQGVARRQAALQASVGDGLSAASCLWARQACDLERQQYDIEQQISALLQLPEFESYHSVFDEFGFGPMTRSVLLSRIFPFQRFLDEQRQPIIEWVKGEAGRRSRRHRSLGKFRLSLGMGTVVKQSGNSRSEVPGGPAYARSALFQHVKVKIVMKTVGVTGRYLAAHTLYYSNLDPAIPHRLAVLKTASKITKDLFKALLKGLN